MWSVNKCPQYPRMWLAVRWINSPQRGNLSAARHPGNRSCDPATKVIYDCFLTYAGPKSNRDWDRCVFYIVVWMLRALTAWILAPPVTWQICFILWQHLPHADIRLPLSATKAKCHFHQQLMADNIKVRWETRFKLVFIHHHTARFMEAGQR